MYQACVLSVLLYGPECWTLFCHHNRKLESFYHRCLRTILGISNSQQWEHRITSQEIRQRWGDTASVTQKVAARHLEWPGHFARMPKHCQPQKCLFGWLPQPRPRVGPRKRWRDANKADLQEIKVPEAQWYKLARTSRQGWRATYTAALEEQRTRRQEGIQLSTLTLVVCQECTRTFRREGDKKRHKCTTERLKPVSEQLGAVQCQAWHRWFRSRGGHAVHRCRPDHN